jgi:hypothetical protein
MPMRKTDSQLVCGQTRIAHWKRGDLFDENFEVRRRQIPQKMKVNITEIGMRRKT